MTSRNMTRLFSLQERDQMDSPGSLSGITYRLAFGAIGWPWLLLSLWGGTKNSKRRLMRRVGLEEGSLPHLGSWKADTGFLHLIVDAVETLQPRVVVELGAGATTLVCAKALARNGGGELVSYDQHEDFVDATSEWVISEGGTADIRWAPLTAKVEGWPGRWYSLRDVPDQIDLLIIDGPPWAVHPFVRGAAECLFDRLAPGAIVLLDDASRPGERVVAGRWKKRWPELSFKRNKKGSKGTLLGQKVALDKGHDFPFLNANENESTSSWRQVAAMAALFVTGWLANSVVGDFAPPAQAASIVQEAQDAYSVSLARQQMVSQAESPALDRGEILASTGLLLPPLPDNWELRDVQLYPSELGNSLMISLFTENGELVSLFAAKAETPAREFPLMDMHNGRAVAYWEEGPMAFAVIGELQSSRLLELAALLASSSGGDR